MGHIIQPPWLDWALRLPAWTPASLPSLAAWYEAVDVDATLVKAVQPSINSLGTWTAGANWSVLGEVATHTAGVTDSILQYASLITGNRYSTNWDLLTRTAGEVSLDLGGAAVYRTTPGSYSEEATALGTYFGWTGLSTFAGSVGNLGTLTNLSRTRWNPKAGSLGGYLSQATATAQPWWDGATSSVRFDVGWMAHSAAASNFKLLHDGGAFTTWCVVNPTSLASDSGLYSSSDGTANAIGQFLRLTTAGALRLAIGNGSAYTVNVTTSGGLLVVGTPALVVTRYAGSGNVETWVGGVKRIDSPLGASPSASNPTGFAVGSLAANSTVLGATAKIPTVGIVSGYLSDNELALLGAYFKANRGVAWT